MARNQPLAMAPHPHKTALKVISSPRALGKLLFAQSVVNVYETMPMMLDMSRPLRGASIARRAWEGSA
ncbi:hypothetical protein AGR4C_Lc100015 [Agrobacterium tumefaciens str. Kerr 14]|uniref:Uncharacterized protein n=1 Tax=Agrobacterium tumefaciens str. Kerr 14 TaxID=1183424 RepID=A0A1S7R278_AGRTU|nr:hypothetical protein AGR4C_Lc100015 [Agrobacterium tumefaciens str. Kerr 14]